MSHARKAPEPQFTTLQTVADAHPDLDYYDLDTLLQETLETLLEMENLAGEPASMARRWAYLESTSLIVRNRCEQQGFPMCEGSDRCWLVPAPRGESHSKKLLCDTCAKFYEKEP